MSSPIKREPKGSKIRGNLGRGRGHHLHQWQVPADDRNLPELVAKKGKKEGDDRSRRPVRRAFVAALLADFKRRQREAREAIAEGREPQVVGWVEYRQPLRKP